VTIKAFVKVAKRLAAGDFGYSQSDRWSALGTDGLVEPGNADCSSSTGMALLLGGLVDRDLLRGTWYTGNLASKLTSTGLFRAVKVGGWSLTKLRAQVGAGDILLGPGHVVVGVGGGKIVSFEADERGRSTGGRKGDQTGSEGRVREVYARSRGWSYLLRVRSGADLKGRVLDAYAAGGSTAAPLDRLARRAPQDGRLWAAFVAAWRTLDAGMALTFDPTLMAVPDPGHAFVVLGAGGAELRRRLALAKAALDAHPGSRVLVTGGKPDKAGLTEAERGRDWLLGQGITADRILIETKASSTIGNAKGSLPILRKAGISSYTLVSDASHLRRGQVLFLAAQLQIECRENRTVGLAPVGALAFDDYSPAPVKTAAPVTASTRRTIAAEVASLLGLTDTYTAAL
jgi:uncharacterized SAM-binding protein YcdF (DUF218 family)